jgi:hypothetical protein
MNPAFKKLVDAHIRTKKLYGENSKECKEALEKAKRWQDACKHDFSKKGMHGLMCKKCNYPLKN